MTQKEPVYIFGASGHAKVIIDIVERERRYVISGLFDDNQSLWGKEIFGYTVLGGQNAIDEHDIRLIVAIGNNRTRFQLGHDFLERGFSFAKAIHPSAQISRGVAIGAGTVLMAGTAVNADSVIGEHVILNTGATVDHDCIIGDAAHIAPGAHLCGAVYVGNRTFVGAGATIIPNLRVGDDVMIAAGATVIRDVPDGVTVMGTPANVVQKHVSSLSIV